MGYRPMHTAIAVLNQSFLPGFIPLVEGLLRGVTSDVALQ